MILNDISIFTESKTFVEHSSKVNLRIGCRQILETDFGKQELDVDYQIKSICVDRVTINLHVFGLWSLVRFTIY